MKNKIAELATPVTKKIQSIKTKYSRKSKINDLNHEKEVLQFACDAMTEFIIAIGDGSDSTEALARFTEKMDFIQIINEM